MRDATPLFEPADAQAAAAMLAHAAHEGTRLIPHGSRSKLTPRAAADVATLSSRRLTQGLAHYAGDLVATVPAGATLRDVNAVLRAERQWIPIDPPFPTRATIGGIVGANDSGPRRHRFGSPRDLIIGIEVALTSGTVAHSGGRVVKNVAGYDLARLFCGSHGSLGVITSVTFKLAPVAPASRTVVAPFASVKAAVAAAGPVATNAALSPSAIELLTPEPRLLIRFESTERSADFMASEVVAHLASEGHEAQVVADADEAALWRAHEQTESADDGVVALLSVLPSAAGSALEEAERLARDCGIRWSATGRAAMGLFRMRVDGAVDGVRRFALALRPVLVASGAHVRFAGATDVLPGGFDLAGPIGSAARVAFAVKQQFDPTGILPYPWAEPDRG